MNGLSISLIAITVTAAAGAGLADTGRGRGGHGLLKMTAASGYLAFALHLGALDTGYGRLLFLALALSWVGDLLLIGADRRSFMGGLGAFLLAHLGYAVAFGTQVRAVWPMVAAGAGMAGLAVVVMTWLERAELPGEMRAPVLAYLAAIAVMVTVAAGTLVPEVLVGAVAFAGSDLFVARHRFVVRAPVNRLVGLPLYFAAQLLIASSLRG